MNSNTGRIGLYESEDAYTWDDPALPPAFAAEMFRLLGRQDAEAYFQALGTPAQSGLRVNTLKLSPNNFRAICPWPLEPVVWCEAGFRLPEAAAAGGHIYHAAGLYYLQEPSAMAVGTLLDPLPGELVLDLAAAPGGKATHLASLLGRRGWLVANEIHPRRAWELAENLERWGVHNVAVLNDTPERLAAHFGAVFDRVLLDAPCSGEGMFRKSASARRDWSLEYVAGCALRQSDILVQAGKLVRPGGRLLYATCTFNPQENEQVIARFLDAGDFTLLDVERMPGFTPGHPEWLEAPDRHPELERAVRLWPQHAAGEGHFVAVMERAGMGQAGNQGIVERVEWETDLPSLPRRPRDFASPDGRGVGGVLFDQFWQETLQVSLPEGGRLQVEGWYQYWMPPEALDLGGLRVIHPGWWLGTFKKGRFEPSQALAMGLKAEDARRCLDLLVDSAQCAAYLRGETLASPGEDGWLLVCVEGFPLGWGKRVSGVVKNYYPIGLRRAGKD